ncbi:hypothetical protein CMQ_6816 [Grosmannia clavigera kw1407]|uniref:Clr5 domain-containing protein n=1 Tax=Grosmannia clavigera (strain kw1407 / UAMH 11150) TaxID=655863 RepID=F0X7F9_GROCL|nr:uncharacterized protein CMQ_6816 [Grosmannia clavigera kw1407]EFX06495.1 hypothetical protein CMQ_6816 [Grosmannia clavigera kw1407]
MDRQGDSYREHQNQQQQQYGIDVALDASHDTDIERVLLYQPEIFGLVPHDSPADHTAFDYEVNLEDGWQHWDQAAVAASYTSSNKAGEDSASNSYGIDSHQTSFDEYAGYDGYDGYDGYAAAYCFNSSPGPTADETAAADSGSLSANVIAVDPANDKTEAATTAAAAARPSSYRFRHDLPVPTDWDPLQPLLRELYMVRRLSLRDVAEIMKEQHHFSAT